MHLYGSNDSLSSRRSEPTQTTIRLVVMGSARVGKTALIKQCLFREFINNYKETIEDTYHYQGDNFNLEILDTSGSHNFPDMMKLAIKGADIFMLVFSVDDYTSFDRVGQLRKDIIDIRGSEVPIIVVGNKSDSETREVPTALADSTACVEWGCNYHDVTAKDADVTCEIFNDILSHYPELDGEKITCESVKDNLNTKEKLRKHDKKAKLISTPLLLLARKLKSIK